jgi:hypothetical protein
MENNIVKHEQKQTQAVSVFSTGEAFEHAQRIAKMLSSSDIIPASYKGNVANTLVALEMANRLGDSPLMVMQNMNVIHGKPSWGSSYIIAKLNSCGRFNAIKFKVFGEGDQKTCIAWTNDTSSGELIEGPPISIEMAKKEGWFTKNGSKWPTMPDLMLRYRAAAFFGRLYAPELMMGMHTTEEMHDVHGQDTSRPMPKEGTVVILDPVQELNQQASKITPQTRGKKAAASSVAKEEPALISEAVASTQETDNDPIM